MDAISFAVQPASARRRAVADTVPSVVPLFWSFRVMVGLGFFFIFFFAYAFGMSCKRDFQRPAFLRPAVWMWRTPWLAAELGWVVAEYGRQPWAIGGILLTFLGSSALSVPQVLFTLTGFVVLYSALLVVHVILMKKYIATGPGAAMGFNPQPTDRALAAAEWRREPMGILFLRNSASDLVAVPRRAAHRLRHHGRLRPRSGDSAAVRRPYR